MSLSQVPRGFGAHYRDFPAFLARSNRLTAKLRRLAIGFVLVLKARSERKRDEMLGGYDLRLDSNVLLVSKIFRMSWHIALNLRQ